MNVVLSKSAQKDLQKLPEAEKKKVYKKLQLLKLEPFIGKKLTGEFANLCSLKVWPYRILYDVNTLLKKVEIHKIAHRQGVYN